MFSQYFVQIFSIKFSLQVSTQKQIKSWSVLEKLSSKVVYDKKTEKYVGVFGNKSIRCWDITTRDVNKCKKLKAYLRLKNIYVLYVCLILKILIAVSEKYSRCDN